MRVAASFLRTVVPSMVLTASIPPVSAQFSIPPPVYVPPSQVVIPPLTAHLEDEGEEVYADAVRLWQTGQFDQAENSLRTFNNRFSHHPRASFVNNLLGRLLLDTGRPAQGAVVLWENFQGNPNGSTAAESLFYYSKAILSQPVPARATACQLFNYIEKRYKTTMSDSLAGLIRDARPSAGCADTLATEAVTAKKGGAISTPAKAQSLTVSDSSKASLHQRRLALVIGNGSYNSSLGALSNPINDAKLVASVLRQAGFEVELELNTDQRRMKGVISRFGTTLDQLGKGGVGLFYYGGHGFQMRGANYLVPIDATIRTEADVDVEAVSADSILTQMDASRSQINIVILDACRNNPVFKSSRSVQRGLAEMKAPPATFISYSTAPGSVAADGDGANSPFAEALVAELPTRGEPIEVAFRNIRRVVLRKTDGQQVPWEASSLVDAFAFFPIG